MSIWRRLAVICGLSAVAFVAPILDLYGRNPEVFVANRSSALEIILFAFGVTLFVPLLSWPLLAVARALSPRALEICYRSLIGLLALATGLVISRQVLPDNTVGAMVLMLAVGAGVYWLATHLETLLLVGALAVPVVLVMFLATSASARLIWDEPEEETPTETTSVDNPVSLVMLQLDEMPLASIIDTDGTINSDLFPNFARLADEGTWYRNALSDSIATTQSVPAILTGNRGETGQSPSYVEHPDNMFTLLGDSLDMHVIEWVAELCPEEVCPEYAGRAPARFSSLVRDVGVVYGHLTLPAALREGLPSIDNAWKGFLGQGDNSGANVRIEGLPVPEGADRQDWINWVQRLINGIEPDTEPTLSYAHLRAPHVPWATNPSGTHYERPEEYTEVSGVEGDGYWGADPQPALLGFQRHLLQVGFLDTMIGRLLDHLVETGTWDETMVVVIADHGASFVPGEHRRWPYEDNRDDLYRVPLFIKYPGQTTGETVDLPVFGIDVLPTIVDVMDVETDWEFDGTSLLELDEERPHEPIRWCCNSDGVSTDLDILFDQAARNHSWIPDQTSWLGVIGAGSNGSLVGHPLTKVDVSTDEGYRWSLELGATLEDVDRSTGMVQTLITGRVETATAPVSHDALIVLNDVVAGVARLSMDTPTSGVVSGLVAEELVRDGVNDVDLLISDGNGGWVGGHSDEITLELMDPDGRLLELSSEGSRRVQVDPIEPTTTGWEVTGWAADVGQKLAPDTVYLFAGDQLLAWGPPNVDNENVVRWFKSEDLLRSGFSFEVAEADVPSEVDRLIVVAEFGGVAVADPATLTR